MKKKIAFVVVRYGKEINGGAEYHCRMLAERLVDKYDVEVLTTCVRNYLKGTNDYRPGLTEENGVAIRRFPVAPITEGRSERWFMHRSRPALRTRRFLSRIGVLGFVSMLFPVWNWGYRYDVGAIERSVFFSPELNDFVSEHKDDYAVFIAITAEYAPFYFTAMNAGEKMIAIPTLHDTKVSYRPFMTQMFPKIRFTGFNTEEEWRLAKKLFGRGLKNAGIISVGIETPEPKPWDIVREKFGLPDKYICYIGRIEEGKVGKLMEYYSEFSTRHPELAVPIVMVGYEFQKVEKNDNVVLTGFVSDEEKRTILQHSSLLVNPSQYESLSLIVLEALNDKIPVLVNGKCAVLKDHCIKSNGAVKYYTDQESFISAVSAILGNPEVYSRMQIEGYGYYAGNYSWDKVMPRLYDAIERVSSQDV